MSPTQQQKRRRELHAMPIRELKKLYAKLSGHLLFEVENMVRGLHDDGRQIMVDSVIRREIEIGTGR